MIFAEVPLTRAFLIEGDKLSDERGFFGRIFSAKEFEVRGLDHRVSQTAVSFNRLRGTLRGMHYQAAPHEQAKLVRCTRGIIYDVIIDLRPTSPTFSLWFGVELSGADLRMIYVPPGFAHGFETLQDESEVSYQMSTPYHPESERGIRWNDPFFAVDWPFPPTILSVRDARYLDWNPTDGSLP